MRKNQLYEALKAKAALENKNGSKAEMSLGDAARVKVLSPSALVFKRFIRNKLAIVGSCISDIHVSVCLCRAADLSLPAN